MSNGQTGIVGTMICGCNKVLIMATILPRDNFFIIIFVIIIIIVQHLKYDTLYFRPKHCNDLIISNTCLFVLILCLLDVMEIIFWKYLKYQFTLNLNSTNNHNYQFKSIFFV